HRICIGSAIALRACKHVVSPFGLVPSVIWTSDEFAFFRCRYGLAHRETETRVAVEMRYVLSDRSAFGVHPGARTNAVTRIDYRRIAGSLSTEVGAPGFVARTDRLCERLAMSVGALQATKVAAVAHTDACYKKAHWILEWL